MPDEDPLGVQPTRRERRGDFPVHSDTPRPVLTAQQARDRACKRLEEWRRTHG